MNDWNETIQAMEAKRKAATASSPEKAAPIPADVRALIGRLRSMGQDLRPWGPDYRDRARADMLRAAELLADRPARPSAAEEPEANRYETFVVQPQATYTHAEVEALLNEVSVRFRTAHLEHALRDRAVEEPAPTRASLAVILDEVRRPSASPENHLRQIGVMIERMMEVAESERLRRDVP